MMIPPCPACAGPVKSQGFLREGAGYTRRLMCIDCGHAFENGVMQMAPAAPSSELRAHRPVSDGDQEVAETIAMLLGWRVEHGGMEVTDRTLDEIAETHANSPAYLRGFVFPAVRLLETDAAGVKHYLVAVDQGRVRLLFPVRSRHAL